MIEKPVRSPIVPPIAERISTNFAAWSFVILSKVEVSNLIFTNLRLGLMISKSKHIYQIVTFSLLNEFRPVDPKL